MIRTATARRTERRAPRTIGQKQAGTTAPVPPGRTWTITTSSGYSVRGYLPDWAEDDPSRAGVPQNALRNAVYDVVHRASFDGQLIRLARGGYGPGEDTWALTGNIECTPDADDGHQSGPVVNVHIIEDFWLTGLGPAELAVFAAQLRAQADRLDEEVRPRLIAYRADWAAHRHRRGRARADSR